MLTLRQLRYLDALARHGNFGRAAEECAISQPALSMQIRELEQELGAELVTRRHGMTVLTEAGVEVARRAGPILSATRDLADCVRHGGPLLSKTLRLGVIPTLAPYVLPLLLPELHRTHPDLCLDLLETQTKTLVTELAQGTLDVLLLALPLEKTEFETVVLFSDRFLFAVPADDPLPERARVKPSDVSARRLVLLEEGHCLRDQALIYCGQRDSAQTKLGATSLATASLSRNRNARSGLCGVLPRRGKPISWSLARFYSERSSANSRIRLNCGALRTLRSRIDIRAIRPLCQRST
jgi:LysR family transcriptional regulator, hydrogen peroxide-inducible genes activator